MMSLLRRGAALAYLLSQMVAITRTVVVLVAAISFILIAHDQGQDLVRTLPTRDELVVAFVVSGLLLAGAAWYWSQKSLIPFADRLAFNPWKADLDKNWAAALQDWYPRALGVVPLLAAAIGATRTGGWGIVALATALAVVMLVVLAKRRAWFRLGPPPHLERVYGLRSFLRTPWLRTTRIILAVKFALGLLASVAVVPLLTLTAPLSFGHVGAIAVAFVWIAAVIPLLSIVAVIGSRWHLPTVLVALAGLGAISTCSPRLHEPERALVAFRAPERPERPTLDPRCGYSGEASGMDWLQDHACEWLKARTGGDDGRRPIPVLIVSSEGGGIRAAMWTSLVLARLTREHPELVERIWATSGVSGGSLGLAAWTAMRADALVRAACGALPPQDWSRPLLGMMERDFLSPTLAALVFTDSVRPVFRWPLYDRAGALERGWIAADEVARGAAFGAPAGPRFAAAYDDLWAGPCPTRVPLLFLNATEIHDGLRAVAAPAFVFGDARARLRPERDLDGFERVADLAALAAQANRGTALGLTLAAATSLSARFPYVTPAANVLLRDLAGRRVQRQYVDGGYADNSGAATLRDALYAMPMRLDGRKVLPIVLHLTNDDSQPAPEAEAASKTSQTLAPALALVGAWRAGVLDARVALATLAERRGGRFVQLDLPRRAELPVPVGWTMSPPTVDHIVASAATPAWDDAAETAAKGKPDDDAARLRKSFACLDLIARGEVDRTLCRHTRPNPEPEP